MKKFTAVIALLMCNMSMAFAQADVNKADQAALDGIRGIGPAMSKRILDERKKGQFKDWADFEARVKGVGTKSAEKLSERGLTVNGQSRGKSAPANTTAKGTAKKAKEQESGSAQPAQIKG